MISRYTLPAMGRIWSDENRFGKMLQVEILALEAMVKLGHVPPSVINKVKQKAAFDVRRIAKIEKKVKHDVIAFLTSVGEHVGPASKYIHMGLTSSDVLDTSLSVLMKEAGVILIKDMEDLCAELRKKARKYKYTIMVGRTHGVHAEPITFGLKMALFYEEARRNIKRMKEAVNVISFGKISGAVGTYANVDPFVERYVCRKLGLKPDPISTQIIQRDRHAQYLCTIGIAGSSLEKLATEIRNLQRSEVLEAEEYFSEGQKGSSAMPHKRNPITCERIAGLARVLRGNAVAAMEDVPLWHERDITHSSVERIIIPDSTILLDYMLQQMSGIIANLQVYPENMERNLNLTGGAVFSQLVMLNLVRKGLSREKAYEIVQRNAMRVHREKVKFVDALTEDAQLRRYASREEIAACFDTRYYLKNVDTIFRHVGI
jgi:adenylosuccinate lyase